MLAEGCSDLVKMYLPLCPRCYHRCVSGKTPDVELKDGLGTAKFNTSTQVIDYPASVPKNLPDSRYFTWILELGNVCVLVPQLLRLWRRATCK
jgi:hypothetical protein